MVIYHDDRVNELRGSLDVGVWPLSKKLAAGTASGISALARRLTPGTPGEVVELEPMDDDRPGWMPRDDEEVA